MSRNASSALLATSPGRPLDIDSVDEDGGAHIKVATPPARSTGATARILDPLDWIHAVTNQIPDRGKHASAYSGLPTITPSEMGCFMGRILEQSLRVREGGPKADGPGTAPPE